jgi:Fibronectin type III domain
MKAKIFFLVLSVLFILSCTDNSTGPNDEGLKKPTNLELQQIDNTSILLTWEDNSDEETGFKIDRKIDIAAWENDFQILSEGATSYMDTNLTVFGEYQYRLSAYNEIAETESITASLLFRDLDSLAAPSNLILEQLDVYSIQITWQDNSSQEEGFRIDRKIGDNAWEIDYQILEENSTLFTDEDLIIIDTYIYRVYAIGENSYSEYIEADIDFFFYDVSNISVDLEYYPNPYWPGQESIYLTANLLDVNLNLVEREYTVWFKIIGGPEGMNINNVLFGTEDSLAVESEDGQAIVSINSGTAAGMAAVEIFVFDTLNERISVIKSNININVSAPPENIEITTGGVDTGMNVGGGVWQIEVAAIVTDLNGNPVSYGTAVWFSLEDPDNPNIDPNWASIEQASYVGNENANGDSIPGVAYTQLSYEGTHTNDELIIWVEVSGTTTYTDSTLICMPIQFANIDIVATPSHIDWIGANNNEPVLYSTIRVFVRDGQNNLINYQPIHFTSSHGFPLPGLIAPNDPFIGYTFSDLPHTNGELHKEFGFYKYECSPPIPAPPGTTQVTIEALILGTDVTGQTTLILNRYID